MVTILEKITFTLLTGLLIVFFGLTIRSFAYTAIINGEYVEMVDGQIIEPTEPIEATDYEFVLAEADADFIDITESPELSEVTVELNPYQQIAATATEQDWYELKWVTALESGGEPFKGQMAVVEAIFNRVLSPRDWGNGIHGVLSKKGQFSTYRSIGSSKASNKPNEVTDDAISEVIRNGPSILPSTKYVFFDSLGGVNGRDHIRIGHHTFGREK